MFEKKKEKILKWRRKTQIERIGRKRNKHVTEIE